MSLIINGPPKDLKCEKCGKHISELEPFGGVGDFADAKLVKTFRSMNEGLNLSEEEYTKFEEINDLFSTLGNSVGWEKAELEVNAKFGIEDVQRAMFYDQLSSTITPSWECKDCIIK